MKKQKKQEPLPKENVRELTLVYGEDWVGIYDSGRMVFQDHSFAPDTLVELEISSVEWKKMKESYILADDYDGHFPDNLNDLKRELKLPI